MGRRKSSALKRRNDDDEERGLVAWGGYDEEAVEGHEQEMEEESESDFDKLKVGREIRRIMPPPKGSGWGPNGSDSPILVVWEHLIETPGAERPMRFSCPKKMKREYCFACEIAVPLMRSGRPRDKDKGYEMRAKRRNYLQWFDPRSDEPQIKVYGAGKTIAEALIDLRHEKGDFSHAKRGYEVNIRRRGSGRTDTRYSLTAGNEVPLSDFDFSPNDLFDLTQYIRLPDEDEQAEMATELEDLMNGTSKAKRRSRDDDRGQRTRGSRQTIRDEDDDDEEIIDAEVVEEEPRRRSSKRRRRRN